MALYIITPKKKNTKHWHKKNRYFTDVQKRGFTALLALFFPLLYIVKSLDGTLRQPHSSVANITCTCLCKRIYIKTSSSKNEMKKTPPMITFSCRSCWLSGCFGIETTVFYGPSCFLSCTFSSSKSSRHLSRRFHSSYVLSQMLTQPPFSPDLPNQVIRFQLEAFGRNKSVLQSCCLLTCYKLSKSWRGQTAVLCQSLTSL